MDLLEKFVPKKKKKNLLFTNVGKRVIAGVLHTCRFCVFVSVSGMKEHTYTANSLEKGGKKKKKKNPGINPGQPIEKGRKKKKKNTLLLTNGNCYTKTDVNDR
jgi:hypothetical protein